MAEATIQWREQGVVGHKFLVKYGARPSIIEREQNEWFVAIFSSQSGSTTTIKVDGAGEALRVYSSLLITLGD